MKKMIAMLLALVMALSLVACGEKANDGKTDNDTAKTELVLGTSADYAPFEFMYPDDSGEMVYGGIDVSVAKYIADEMGLSLAVENMGFDYLLASLQKGDFDIVIAAMEATEERLNAADFSDPYYTDYPAMILIKADKADEYTSLDSFSGKAVAAQTATTKEDIVKNDMPGANLVSLQVVTDAVNQLVNDKVDAVVLDGSVAMQYADSNPDLVICAWQFDVAAEYEANVIMITKGETELLEVVNEALAKAYADGLYGTWYDDAVALAKSENAAEVSVED